MKPIILIAAVLVLFVSGIFLITNQNSKTPSATPNQVGSELKNNTGSNPPQGSQFSNPKKSAHYETNTPSHGAVLAGVPINVVIDFNFDLAKPSDIKILKDGQDFGEGETVIDDNKLTMRRNLKKDAPNGLYKVTYNACWPDGSCHDGYFEFAIDRSKSSNFDDQTTKKEVSINMSKIKFMPENIKVSQGTKVTWKNDESEVHYVNTDSHPAHTYYLNQNSKALEKDDQYSLTLDMPGIYPYHCSAHEATMKGSILVI